MPRTGPLVDKRIISPAETALALNLVSETDLLRLKTIARLHARGLPPDIAWDDLLQEAFTRVIVGSRRQPEGVAMVAFLAGVMRSLKAEHWRRVESGSGRREPLRIDRSSPAWERVSPRSRFVPLPDYRKPTTTQPDGACAASCFGRE